MITSSFILTGTGTSFTHTNTTNRSYSIEYLAIAFSSSYSNTLEIKTTDANGDHILYSDTESSVDYKNFGRVSAVGGKSLGPQDTLTITLGASATVTISLDVVR